MNSLQGLTLHGTYQADWEHLQEQIHKQRFPQTFLLQATNHLENGLNFAYNLAAALLCKTPFSPCGHCHSCDLWALGEHPDFFVLSPEKADTVIKIDQVRALQGFAYLTPQLGNKRIVLIHPAEKLNIASTNALLKLLEEPPPHLHCLLVARTLRGLPATLLSRCQTWQLSVSVAMNPYEPLFEAYSTEHPRGKLLNESETLLQDLYQLSQHQLSALELAAKWEKYPLSDFVWLIYLLQTAMIRSQWVDSNKDKEDEHSTQNLALPSHWHPYLLQLTKTFSPSTLFQQLDSIRCIQKHLAQHIHFNQRLVLETLFLIYL